MLVLDAVFECVLDPEVKTVAELVVLLELDQDVQLLIEAGLVGFHIRDQRGERANGERVEEHSYEHPETCRDPTRIVQKRT